MAKLGKWIGGSLGWAVGGPIGGLLGFAVGAFIDHSEVTKGDARAIGLARTTRTTRTDFAVCIMVLVAAVMKADGKVLKSELDYVKKYLISSFKPEESQKMVFLLKDLLQENIPLEQVGYQIKMNMDISARLQLLHFLYGISAADGEIHPSELQMIERIGVAIGISLKDRVSLRSMFVQETGSAYKILEISDTASDEEIKKAYRAMARKHHPDKVAHLGEDVQNGAKVKFQQVSEAYNKICKERGIK